MADTTLQNTEIGPGTIPVSPPVVNVPTPEKTPTGPTGVASSNLANDTLATQTKGVQNLQGVVDQHAAAKAAKPTFNPEASIIDLLHSKGMPSDYTSRSKMAKTAGIKDYIGTAQQNQQLIGYVNNPPKETTGGTALSTEETQTGTATTTETTTGTNKAGLPTHPTTGSAGDVYSPALEKAYGEIADALKERNIKVDQILAGTFPLSSTQQAILDNTKKQFDAIAAIQATANKSYQNSVALAGNRLGTNIQNPTEYASEQVKAVNDGLLRINNLDATAAKTMADLRQGFMDKDYKIINDTYESIQKTLEDKAKAISDLQKRTDDLFTKTREYNEKVREFSLDYQQKASQFAQTQKLEKAKFVAQYGGLVDANTGEFKAGADPTQLPGVITLPAGIGGGLAGHVVDMAAVGNKNLATPLAAVAKANGFGVVSEANSKTFNQALTAYTGINGLIQSGQYPSETKMKDILQKTKSSSLILRLFGSSQPDDIAKTFGAGGGTIPDLQTLTLGQASGYLQNNIYTTMGTNSVAQKYAMNPSLAKDDLVGFVQESPINAENVQKVLTAHPDWTDAKILSVVAPQ